jgi:TldD protein
VDYQTTREQAHWLDKWYTQQGMPVQSHGCAIANTALDCPIQMSPNFLLQPGPDAIDVEDLIKDTERGVYFEGGGIDVDQQVKNGVCTTRPAPREIRNGKLGPFLMGAAVLFNSSELWKNVKALGGEKSAGYDMAGEYKGEPRQFCWCNINAVPIKVANCAIIDTTRRV